MRISRRNVGLEVAVAMRGLVTFPLFLGILTVSFGQVLCVFLLLKISCAVEESADGPVKVL